MVSVQKICHLFEWLVLSIPRAWAIHLKKIVIGLNGFGYLFEKNCYLFERLYGYLFEKEIVNHSSSDHSVTEAICSKINFSRVSIPKQFRR